MRKVGIITLHGYFNYGNRLQNYATQEVMKSLKTNPITIANNVSIDKTSKRNILNKFKGINLKRVASFSSRQIKKLRKKFYLSATEKREISLNEIRTARFKKFTEDYINETDYVINNTNVSKNYHEKFDYFIVGSDQVWNPNYMDNSNIYFLTFAPTHKRIAYSASFGISTLPHEYTENYKEKLSQFKHISVREEAGAKIVRSLTGRDVEVVVDPTLMLDKEEWLSIAKKSEDRPNKPYLLTYFLGKVSDEVREVTNNLCKKYNLEIVRMSDISDEKRYIADPSEFIDYINSAEMFLTDSFHGAVFSILLEKPFIIFDRKSKGQSMGSRIDTLLSKFKLEDRKWGNIKKIDDVFDICFSHVSPILEYERNKSIRYLKNALDIKEE